MRGYVHFPVTTENNRNQNDLYRAPASFVVLACRELLCGQEKDIHKESKEGSCFALLLFRARYSTVGMKMPDTALSYIS